MTLRERRRSVAGQVGQDDPEPRRARTIRVAARGRLGREHDCGARAVELLRVRRELAAEGLRDRCQTGLADEVRASRAVDGQGDREVDLVERLGDERRAVLQRELQAILAEDDELARQRAAVEVLDGRRDRREEVDARCVVDQHRRLGGPRRRDVVDRAGRSGGADSRRQLAPGGVEAAVRLAGEIALGEAALDVAAVAVVEVGAIAAFAVVDGTVPAAGAAVAGARDAGLAVVADRVPAGRGQGAVGGVEARAVLEALERAIGEATRNGGAVLPREVGPVTDLGIFHGVVAAVGVPAGPPTASGGRGTARTSTASGARRTTSAPGPGRTGAEAARAEDAAGEEEAEAGEQQTRLSTHWTLFSEQKVIFPLELSRSRLTKLFIHYFNLLSIL